MENNSTIKAIGVSSGISYAKAICLVQPTIDIENSKNIIDKATANAKLESGISQTIGQLSHLKTLTEQKLGKDKGEIFDAHIQMVNDPEIINEVKQQINDEKVNLIRIINSTFDKYHETFSKMDDPYFKERAVDILDVKHRLLCNISGISIPNILDIKNPVILVTYELTPSNAALLNHKYIKGIVSEVGGKTSHAAIITRNLEIPTVFGAKNIFKKIKDEMFVGIDGKTGIIDLNPDENEWKQKIHQYEVLKQEYEKYAKLATQTLDGKKIKCEANIGNAHDALIANKYGCEGVGLFRTEFLYMENQNWPSEEEQFNAYKEVLSTLKNKLVIIRTLDIGGDKKLPYYEFEPEMNPFLGIRAIRFCLARKDIFKTQLRALGRASIYGKLAIMFPMIANIEEFIEAKKFTLEVFEELKKEGHKVADDILIGMMVEIPSSAVLADKFAEHADFFSIGSNDLIQYSFAADRMSKTISYLYQPNNPALLKLISMTIKGAHLHKRFAGVCGEIGGDPLSIPVLLGLGIDDLSMSPSVIPQARRIINSLNIKDCEILANKALQCATAEEVNKLVKNFLKQHNL